MMPSARQEHIARERNGFVSSSNLVRALYQGSGVLLLLAAIVGTQDGTPSWVSRNALLTASAFCLLVSELVRRSRGNVAVCMNLAAIAIWIAYVARLGFVLVFPTLYRDNFSHLGLMWGSADLVRAFGLIALTTLGWYVGLWLFSGKREGVVPPRLNWLIARRPTAIICLALVIDGVFWYVRLTFGVGLQAAATESHGYLMRLLPVDALFFAILSLTIGAPKRLTPTNWAAVAVYFAGHATGTLLSGGRGGAFEPLVGLAIALVLFRGNAIPKKTLKRLSLLGLMLILVFPHVLGAANRSRAEARSLGEADAKPVSVPVAIKTVSDRLAGLDHLLLVMAYRPDGADEYLTIKNGLLSVVGALVPDRLLPITGVPLGKVFGVFYQSAPWEMAHHGAFFGFGMFFAYAGWLGPAFGGVCAALLVVSLRWVAKSAVVGGWGPLYLLYVGVWMLFISGNVDTLVAAMLSQATILWSVLTASAALSAGAKRPGCTTNQRHGSVRSGLPARTT